MPMYTIENLKTGKVEEEFMTYEEMKALDPEKYLVHLSTPLYGDPSVHGADAKARGNEFRDGVLSRIKNTVPGAKI